MPAITRKGVDPSAGHCFNPRPAAVGSPNVFVNGIPAVRLGDAYFPHVCLGVVHGGDAGSGSMNVIVNGKPVHRIGDSINCGDISASGSPNVFAGG